jgi:hypothetical protein
VGGEPHDLCSHHPLVEEHNLRCSCTTEASEVVAVRHDGFVLTIDHRDDDTRAGKEGEREEYARVVVSMRPATGN